MKIICDSIWMQQGKIMLLVARYDAHSIRRTLPQDSNLLRPINNMMIGYDIAIRRNEKPRAIAHIARLAAPGLFRQVFYVVKLDIPSKYRARYHVPR